MKITMLGSIVTLALLIGSVRVDAGVNQSIMQDPPSEEVISHTKPSNQELKRLSDKLIDAAKSNYFEEIDGLILMGVDVDYTDQTGNTALIIAAGHGHTTMIEKLLTHHANVNHANQYENTALIAAVDGGHTATIEMLLAHHADVNRANRWGTTALLYAAKKGNIAIIERLLTHRADVNHANNDGKTAFVFAEMKGHEDSAKLLWNVHLDNLSSILNKKS